MEFIGIDLHKRIFTVCVLDENEKVIDEMIDVETSEKGLDLFMSRHPPDDCLIVFENLTRAHFAYHYLYKNGYAVNVAHTGHGALGEIVNSNFKTDRIDAYKLALLCKDMWSGRRFIRRTHISSDENMRMKAVVRVCNVCSNIRDEMYLRIGEYMNLHNIPPHPRFKDIMGMKYRQYLLDMHDPALTIMVNTMSNAMAQIKEANDTIREFARESEDAKLLMSIKGISALTAVTIVTGIDGIYRFETPESLVAFFGLAVPHKESAHKKTKIGVITKEGDPLIRKYLANAVVNHSVWCPSSDLARFYKKKAESMPHWKAVTAAMRKLTCIIWAMLTKREYYNPQAMNLRN